jgi:Capsule polysaccharide biosynthesis protein
MSNPRKFFWRAMQRLNLVQPKKRQFQVFTELYLARLRTAPDGRPGDGSRGAVGVLITPWQQTAVPFFSIECARKLAAEGMRVSILWEPRNIFGNAPDPGEVAQIERVLAALGDEFEIIRLPAEPVATEAEPAFFAELAFENAVQKMRGEAGAEEFLVGHPEMVESLRLHVTRVRSFLRARSFDWLLIPGGVWAMGGVWGGVAAELGVPFTTFDSGPGAMLLGHDGATAHFPDVESLAHEVTSLCLDDAAERERITHRAQEQMRTRMRGDDEFRLQPVATSDAAGHRWDVVVPLNLRWDSAAMCRKHLFANVRDWLTQLLAWAEATPGVTLAIRQHPCEKLADYKGADDFSELARDFPGLGERARFFAADENINTYDLIAGAKVVLPFTSRVGIEAVLLGKPAILCARCYYAGCGFAETPETVAQYFALLARAVGGRLALPPEARLAAAVTYYLAETCVEVKTDFTPAPTDFVKWVKQPADAIWRTPESRDLLEALLTRRSLAQVRYRRFVAAETACAHAP